ncbi:MAG: hypothetical protein KIT56_02955 [Gammaproteobacteria bacterium]|nr:hypothetical protein [Gammaproteobacteria bacterium]MCW5582835.1 hypothetical protein [Gammaproteobacteria bacterium]
MFNRKAHKKAYTAAYQKANKEKLKTYKKAKDNCLKYPNGDNVSPNEKILSEGKASTRKYFVVHQDGRKTRVFTASALRMKRKREGDKKLLDDLPYTPETKRRRTNDNNAAVADKPNDRISQTIRAQALDRFESSNPNTEIFDSHNAATTSYPDRNGGNYFYNNALVSYQLLFGDRKQTISFGERELGQTKLPAQKSETEEDSYFPELSKFFG